MLTLVNEICGREDTLLLREEVRDSFLISSLLYLSNCFKMQWVSGARF